MNKDHDGCLFLFIRLAGAFPKKVYTGLAAPDKEKPGMTLIMRLFCQQVLPLKAAEACFKDAGKDNCPSQWLSLYQKKRFTQKGN